MTETLMRFQDLSRGARATIGLLTVGGLIGVAYSLRAFGVPAHYIFLFFILATLIVAGVLALLKFFKSARDKRRAQQLEGAVLDSTGGATGDAAERARVDELRIAFQKKLKTYHERGKDLYSLPWLLQVGEPASGKTAAIRHSDIPFPAGLNEPNQGFGGTYNMDWWFANPGVVIDTAGRLMFQDTREWRELLEQISRARPRCPINGLLLFIPADSLLQDTLEEIHKKAGRIAEQLDGLQRVLDVRFPVYVIISKSDKLTGFPQFFAHIDDPDLQHQIMGWSNPDPLDASFRPETVDQHLKTVCDRLLRRRLDLVLDPPIVDEMSDRRLDQLDALYSFPEQLMRLAPRLKRYLETIFTPNEWSSKPLFLRGIYFTSSLQTGERLDTIMAEMLGVEVKALPEPFSKSRAYFLRDLFTSKVFAEKGLVTRAVNAAKSYQHRRRLVIGSAAAAMALFLTLFVWAMLSFRASIGEQKTFYDQVNAKWTGIAPIVGDGDYRGGIEAKDFQHRGGPWTTHAILARSSQHAQNPPRPKGVLRPMAWILRTDLREDVEKAHQSLVRVKVLDPLMQTAQGRLADDLQPWPDGGAAALAELIRIHRGHAPNIHPLLGVLQIDKALKDDDLQKVQTSVAAAFPQGETHDLRVPVDLAAAIGRWGEARAASDAGAVEQTSLGRVHILSRALEQFAEAESNLWNLARVDAGRCTVDRAQWQEGLTSLEEKHAALEAAASAFDGAEDVLAEARRALGAEKTLYEKDSLALRQAVGLSEESEETVEDGENVLRREVADAIRHVKASMTQIEQRFAAVEEIEKEAGLLKRVGDERRLAFAERYAAYLEADRERPLPENVTLLTLERTIDGFRKGGPKPSTGHATADRLITCVAETATDDYAVNLSRHVLRNTSATRQSLAAKVKAAAEAEGASRLLPVVPLTGLKTGEAYSVEYAQAEALNLLKGWAVVQSRLGTEYERERNQLKQAVDQYRADYCRYWSEDVPGLARIERNQTWPEMRDAMRFRIDYLHEGLEDLVDRVRQATTVEGCDAVECAAWFENLKRQQDAMSRLRDRWYALGATAVQARQQLLAAASQPDFAQWYLPHREVTDGCAGVNYWRDFVLACLYVLTAECGELIDADLARLKELAARFPLARDAERELEAREVQEALAIMQRIMEAGTSSVPIPAEEGWVEDALKGLAQPIQLGDDDKALLSASRRLLEDLAGLPMKAKIDRGASTIRDQCRHLEIEMGSRRVQMSLDDPEAFDLQVPVEQEIVFRFYVQRGGTLRGTEKLSGRWLPLRTFARTGKWVLDVPVREEDGRILRLELENTPTPPKNWPLAADWQRLFGKLEEGRARRLATAGGNTP